ncbi:TPA: hypothetical protein N0F65_005188 [Lagenidium giganteum]|uniref:Temptin Cys/Cys disulfide domain-containing protein n=1 Tax=Lagenidium giganteum TaxID=4803 RepID=A0AAV2YW92_9STRA|nr:TPA: hypothetical protein N0F65_005188 [Lagenidium giganteum]
MKTTAVVVLTTLAVAQIAAHEEFLVKIPNSGNVNGVKAVGHVNPEGGGARNKFGIAFYEAGTTWTKELCQADSDGDGQTNGEELGDPCCLWTEKSGDKVLQRMEGLSNPGDAKSKSVETSKNFACAAGGNSSKSSNATSAPETSKTEAPKAPAPSPSKSEASSLRYVVALAFGAVGVVAACAL